MGSVIVTPDQAEAVRASGVLLVPLGAAVLLATGSPILLAPAMNPLMWVNKATQRNLARLVADGVTLIITGGLRTPADFAKAMALGADGIAVSNSALQAIGCLGMRACHTNNCPVGIATQKQNLRDRLPVDVAAERLARFFAGALAARFLAGDLPNRVGRRG